MLAVMGYRSIHYGIHIPPLSSAWKTAEITPLRIKKASISPIIGKISARK